MQTYGINLNGGNINLKGNIQAFGNKLLDVETILDEHKSFLNFCFNPKIPGILIYNDNKGGQIIKARPLTTPVYSQNITNSQNIDIDVEFETDAAFWESFDLFESSLGSLTKLWKFPFKLPLKFGEYISVVTIKNPTPITIEPYFEIYTNSEFIKITNETTGDFIEIIHAIQEGQKMVIDTKTAIVSLYENNNLSSYTIVSGIQSSAPYFK